MATKIKLMRLGKMRAPYYRIVVADSRTKRDGRSIETIGKYHPKEDPSFMEVDADRVRYWLGVGAQPTEAVEAILKVTGDWQAFKGLPAPPPMLVAAPKADKRATFEEAARASAGLADRPATTPRSAGRRSPAAAADPAAAAAPAPAAPAPAAPAPAAAADPAVAAADKAARPEDAQPTADQASAVAAEQGTTLTAARAEGSSPAGE